MYAIGLNERDFVAIEKKYDIDFNGIYELENCRRVTSGFPFVKEKTPNGARMDNLYAATLFGTYEEAKNALEEIKKNPETFRFQNDNVFGNIVGDIPTPDKLKIYELIPHCISVGDIDGEQKY